MFGRRRPALRWECKASLALSTPASVSALTDRARKRRNARCARSCACPDDARGRAWRFDVQPLWRGCRPCRPALRCARERIPRQVPGNAVGHAAVPAQVRDGFRFRAIVVAASRIHWSPRHAVAGLLGRGVWLGLPDVFLQFQSTVDCARRVACRRRPCRLAASRMRRNSHKSSREPPRHSRVRARSASPLPWPRRSI